MSAIVMRIVTARNGQFAYEVDWYENGTHNNADPTETRRTGNHATKSEAHKEALEIRKEFEK